MPSRALIRTISPVLTLVDSLFGRQVAAIDAALGFFAAGWAFWMVVRPEMFDTGVFVGLSWLPDELWLALFAVLAFAHGLALWLPWCRWLRVGAALLSAWTWIFVSLSLGRIGPSTGIHMYGVIGLGAIAGAIYETGLTRDDD